MRPRRLFTRTAVSVLAAMLFVPAALAGAPDQASGSLPPADPPGLSGVPSVARAMDGPLTGVLMLYASLAGNGSGRITSSPSGIDCPGSCLALFASGTKVTLQASAGAGSSFETWIGDCTGAGGCEVTMTVNRSVTASFRGADCTASIAPTSASFGADGGTGSLSVSAPPGCSWTAVSQASWLAVTSGASGSGPGTVGYSAAANPGPGSRSGTVSVAGHSFVVAQQAPATIAVDFPYTQVVAAVAHKPGLLGTSWLSDLVVHNPGTSDTAASLIYLEEKQDNSGAAARQTRVPAGESVKVADVVGTAFGETSSGGALLVGSDRPLVVSSRTYNDASAGTYGQYIRGISLERAHGTNQEVRLIGLQQNATYRTNVGFVNASGATLDLSVDYVRADGVPIGARPVSLPPWGYAQESEVIGKLTGVSVTDAYALIRTSTPGARYFAYASVVDNRTGDPVLVLPVGTGAAASGTTAEVAGTSAETGTAASEGSSDTSRPHPGGVALAQSPPSPEPSPTDQTVERWVSIGPEGGRIHDLQFNPFDRDVVLAASQTGGLYRSADGGQSWQVSPALLQVYLDRIAFDAARPGLVLVAGSGWGLFRSVDGGRTWEDSRQGIGDTGVEMVAGSTSNPNVWYAVDRLGGVFRSEDSGLTWSATGSRLSSTYCTDLAVHPSNPDIVFVVAGWVLYRSTDAGKSWYRVHSDNIRRVALDPFDPSIVFAGYERLYRSTDGGLTWQSVLDVSYVTDLEISHFSAGVLFVASGQGVWQSVDRGVSWRLFSSAWPSQSALSVAIGSDSVQTLLVGHSYDGVLRTRNGGGEWVQANSGLLAREISCVSPNPLTDQALVVADRVAGIFTSSDGGRSWTPRAPLPVFAMKRAPSSPAVLYAAGVGSERLVKSSDGGMTWVRAQEGIEPVQLEAVAVDPIDANVAYVGSFQGGVLKTVNGGQDWVRAGDGIRSATVLSLEVDPRDSRLVYAGAGSDGVLLTTDGGVSWVAANAGLEGREVAVVAIHPSRPETLFAGTYGGGVFRTTNKGATWQAVGLAGRTISVIVVDPRNPEAVYAGGYAGVYRSVDGGSTWSPMSEGLDGAWVNDLVVGRDTLFAATSSRSLFKFLSASCTFGLSSSSATFGPLGGKGSFAVATPAGCQWTAGTQQNWIAVTRGGGVGEGLVEFAVTANPTSGPRTGTITAGGQSFTVTQTGCTTPAVPALTAPSAASSGASYTVSWTATSPDGQYEIDEATRADFLGATRLTVSGASAAFQHAVAASTTYRYRVRALVTCAAGTQASAWSTAGQTVVQGSGSGVPWWVPAAAHVGGVAGTDWRTDLEVHNPGLQTLSVSMTALKRDQSNLSPSPHGFQLLGGRSQRFEDVLSGVFGMDGAAALRLIPTSGAVMVTSRTYNNQPGGTYGQFIAGVGDDEAVPYGRIARVVQLAQSTSTTTGYRTNLGVVNATAASLAVEIVLYRGDGTKLGSTVVTLTAYEYRQLDRIFATVTSGEVSDGYAVLRTPTPGGRFFAYASVVDNRSGDPIYVPAQVVAAGQ